MKKGLFTLILGILLLSLQDLSAQDYKTSIGLRLGTNFSVSGNVFISEKSSIEGTVGFSREGGQSFFSSGAFYKLYNQFSSDTPTLKWYYGGGLFYTLGNSDINARLALASIIGLEYTFTDTPINIFIDGVPYLNLLNGTNFDAEASLGVRYIF